MLRGALVVVVVAISLYVYAAFFSVALAGGAPVVHVGIPWGLTHEELATTDLSGKVFVVTGANSGLGFSTTWLLANSGAKVIMGCRTKAKCDAAIERIRKEKTKKGELEGLVLDLGSFKATKAFADAIEEPKIDSLILNAGMMAGKAERTSDGLELSFQANHVSGQFLAGLLMEKLEAGIPSSIVALTSSVHTEATPGAGVPLTMDELEKMADPASFDSVTSYAVGKLANILFVREIDRRYHSKGVSAIAVHPGLVETNFIDRAFEHGSIQTPMEPLFKVIQKYVHPVLSWRSDDAALTTIAAVLFSEKFHGKYLICIGREGYTSSQAKNDDVAKRFFDFTEEIISGQMKS